MRDGTDALLFDCNFESGNIGQVFCVRHKHSTRMPSMLPSRIHTVKEEYNLRLRNDINTEGNIQWFYFRVRNIGNDRKRVRFNIINMRKRDSLYNYGMLPLVYSVKQSKNEGKGWQRCGVDVCYYQSLERYEKRSKSKGKKNQKRKERPYYILTFTVDLSEFDHDDELFFVS